MSVPSKYVPQAVGAAMPKTPQELMKMIQAQKKKDKKKSNGNNDKKSKSTVIVNKHEEQSENLESKLMELEDYTYKPEGIHRLIRTFEIVNMETEDDLSVQLALFYKKEQAKIDLREQLRKEVEERKLQEQKEREERKIAAEKRRAAVVERLRLQAEAEERRKQDAIDAITRAENEKQRAIQYEINRLISDQVQICIEDELSQIVEVDYREQVALKIWQQKEKERLIEWEKQQRLKDQADEASRQARMAELEERKQKLIKLKEQQMAQQGGNGTAGNSTRNNAKEEADKLNKQLRIQNKAKFVSKKIQVAQQQKIDDETAVSVLVDSTLDSLNLPPLSVTQPTPTTPHDTTTSGADDAKLQVMHQKFVEEIKHISEEVTLKDMQKELMAEKRALRIELRSDNTTHTTTDTVTAAALMNGGGGGGKTHIDIAAVSHLAHAHTPGSGNHHTSGTAAVLPIPSANTPLTAGTVISKAVESHTNAIKERIAEIAYKEHVIQIQLDSLAHHKEQNHNSSFGGTTPIPTLTPTTTAAAGDNHGANNSASSSDHAGVVLARSASSRGAKLVNLGSSSRNLLHVPAVEKQSGQIAGASTNNNKGTVGIAAMSSQNVLGTSSSSSGQPHSVTNSGNVMFKQAESLLREGTQLLAWLHAYQSSLSPPHAHGSSGGGNIGSAAKTTRPASARPADLDPNTVQANTRRITIVTMEMTQLAKALTKDSATLFDPVGYAEKLTSSSADLKKTLQKVTDLAASAAEYSQHHPHTQDHTQQQQPLAESSDHKELSAVTKEIGKEWLNISHATNPIPQSTTATAAATHSTSSTATTTATSKPLISQSLPPTPHVKPTANSTGPSYEHAHAHAHSAQSLTKSATISEIPLQTTTAATATSNFATSSSLDNLHSSDATSAGKPHEPSSSAAPDTVALPTEAPVAESDGNTTSEEEEDDDDDENDDDGNGDTFPDGSNTNNNKASEAATDFTNIPGWEECINTAMYTAAHHAAFYGYLQVLEVLSQYFDCFSLDTKHRTPLFYASLSNQLDCVAFLIGLNPEWIDVGDEKGDTPLHAAAIANGIETLRFLLSCEANPDTANYNGLTPAHLARTKDSLVVLHEHKALLYCVDSKSRMPLWFACNDGRADCASFLCHVTPFEYLLWPDDEGETCLHKSAANGHAKCVELLCSHFKSNNDLYTLNRKGHTAAHVASNSSVLKVLYENGMNLYITDSKLRNPLFFACFFGRIDCVVFLIEIAFTMHKTTANGTASSNGGNGAVSVNGGSGVVVAGSGIKAVLQLSPRGSKDTQVEVQSVASPQDTIVPECMKSKDFQGDTALHAACLCGHIQCVNILCFYLLNVPNNQHITPEQLAVKAGHIHIAKLVAYYETQRSITQYERTNKTMVQIYGTHFTTLTSTILYYGSRWTLGFDHTFNANYYIDRCIPNYSQWERPETYDESIKDETQFNKAASILYAFYSKYNSEKLCDMNHILTAFKGNYTELFINLANKYAVEDLSLFSGVDFD